MLITKYISVFSPDAGKYGPEIWTPYLNTFHALSNAEILITFFSHPIKNLKIPDSKEVKPFAEKISHLILKAIFKCITRKYQIRIAINHVTDL